MKSNDLLRQLEELCELDHGTLEMSSIIDEIPGWSSLTFLGLIALIDDYYSIPIKPRQIIACTTVDDLIALVGQLRAA